MAALVEEDISALDFAVEDVCCDRCDEPATHRVLQHNCCYGLGCLKCIRKWKRGIEATLARQGVTCCETCKRLFDTFEDYARVVPL